MSASPVSMMTSAVRTAWVSASPMTALLAIWLTTQGVAMRRRSVSRPRTAASAAWPVSMMTSAMALRGSASRARAPCVIRTATWAALTSRRSAWSRRWARTVSGVRTTRSVMIRSVRSVTMESVSRASSRATSGAEGRPRSAPTAAWVGAALNARVMMTVRSQARVCALRVPVARASCLQTSAARVTCPSVSRGQTGTSAVIAAATLSVTTRLSPSAPWVSARPAS